MKWKEATALEVIHFTQGKTVDGHDDRLYGNSVTRFTDGTELKVTVEDGFEYSEYTSEPARVVFEIGVP